MADSLEQLLLGVQAFKSGAESATQKVLSVLGTQANLTSGIADTYKQKAVDDSTVREAAMAADQAKQFAITKAANLMGANLRDSGEVLTKLSDTAAAASDRKQAAALEIERKRNIKFTDDPLGFIAAQFSVQGDIASHNAANLVLRDSESRIAAVNNAAQTTMQTQAAISEPLSAAAMQASSRNAAVEATIAAKNAEIAALNYGAKGIEFALNASKETLALGFQAQAAKNSSESLELSRQRAEQDKVEFKFRQEEYAQRREDRIEATQIGQSVVNSINLGRKALLGPNAENMDDISSKMAIATLKGKGELSTEMNKFYQAGERVKLTGGVSYGNTPAQAADTLQKLPVSLNPTQTAVKNILGQAASDTNAGLKASASGTAGKDANPIFVGVDSKNTQAVEAAYNARTQQIMSGYDKNIRPGDVDNPNQIASINQLVANSPTVAALPVVQKVLLPLMKQGTQLELNDKRVMSMIGDAVSEGRITHKEAVDISTVAHVGVLANIAMRNFKGFGITPSYSYNTKVETNTGGWSQDETVDITKPDAVSRALIKMQAAKMTANSILGPAIKLASDPVEGLVNKLMGPATVTPEGPYTGIFQPQPKKAAALDAWVNGLNK